jgi:hypothetical protein
MLLPSFGRRLLSFGSVGTFLLGLAPNYPAIDCYWRSVLLRQRANRKRKGHQKGTNRKFRFDKLYISSRLDLKGQGLQNLYSSVRFRPAPPVFSM